MQFFYVCQPFCKLRIVNLSKYYELISPKLFHLKSDNYVEFISCKFEKKKFRKKEIIYFCTRLFKYHKFSIFEDNYINY